MRTLPSRTRTLSIVRFGFYLGLAATAILPSGCRSTRSGLSSLPGMGWVGPRDESISLGSWDESNGPSLPTPSQEATPQIAGPTTKETELPQVTPRKSYPLEPKPKLANRSSDAARESAVADQDAPTTYPNTGYPAPFASSSTPAGSPAKYAASDSNPDQSYGEPAADRSTTAGSRRNAAPERGFYGSKLTEAAEADTAASDFGQAAGEDARDLVGANDPRQQYSRFSEGSANDLASSSGWGDDAATRANEAYGEAASSSGDLGDRALESTRGTAENLIGEAANVYDTARTRDDDNSFDTARETVVGASQGFAKDASEMSQAGNDRFGQQLQGAGEGLKGGVGRIGETARNAVGATQDRLSQAYDSAEQRISNAVKPLQNAYGQATTQSGNLVDRATDALPDFGQRRANSSQPIRHDAIDDFQDAASQAGQQLGQAADDLDMASPYNTHAVPSTQSSTPTRRVGQPWRPGGTSTYSGSLDQTRNQSRFDVIPASYPSEIRTGDRRLAPAYH